MSRDQFIGTARDSDGDVVSTAQVTVYNAGTTTPVSSADGPFSTEGGAGLRGNPYTPTGGDISFWCEPGAYDVKIEDTASPPAFAMRTVRFVSMPFDYPYGPENPQSIPAPDAVVLRVPHAFSLDVTVANGDSPPGFQIDTNGGQQISKISKIRFYTEAGTASFNVTRNGSTMSGFTGNASTTKSSTDPTDITVADGDIITIVVTAASGCTGLSVTVYEDIYL